MSFPKHLGRKPTGVELLGDVPEHWHLKRFKQILVERNERSESGEERLLSVSSYTGVSPRDEIIDVGEHLSRAESLEGYKLCYENDLVMNIMLAWNRGLAFTDYDGIVSPSYCVFSLVDDSDPKFLNYLVRSNEYTLYFEAYSSGVIKSRLRMYPDRFGQLNCGLPPLDEQKAISYFLDAETSKIDGLVSEQCRLIELLKEKRQAVISHTVTKGLNPSAPMKPSGIHWLGEVPRHWEIGRLNYLVGTRKGVAFKADDFADEGVDVVKASDIKELTIRTPTTFLPPEFVGEYPNAVLEASDLILSTVGSAPEVRNSAVGQLGRVPAERTGSLLNQNTVVVTPSKEALTNDFLYYLIQTTGYRDHLDLHAHGTANQASLNVSDMLHFKIPLPAPTEQAEIAEHLDRNMSLINDLLAEAERAIKLLQERRTALISAAVTGKIDVRDWEVRKTA